ncbi:MAG: ATP-binding protein [Syntrophales bacterium]|nr:ATP-binding protein [Syntrophales bacterium]MCK9527457.1 ATP-binding protein [Syntrophales bacterium]MDX9921561.1 ATP-binding protein [Syntrophales bacterium]
MTAAVPMVDPVGEARFRRLIFVRLFIVSFLLGIAALIQTGGDLDIPGRSLYLVFAIIGTIYVLSVFYMILARYWDRPLFNLSLQAIIDVILITALVYVTGAVESIYSILYPLVIIYGALCMGRRGAIMIASLSAICYGGLLDLEYFGYINPAPGNPYPSSSAGYVFSRLFIHIVSFYITALLASYLVERERQTKFLLTEQEDSFKRLDLLHKSIIESVNVGIITVDQSGMVRSFNRAAEEITGQRRYQAVGRDLDGVMPGISSIMAGRNERRTVVEATVAAADGRDMVLGCSLSPLIDSSLTPMGNIIIFQDLTFLKAMEREVERSKKMAFLGEMSAVLAHELRNPLASISGSIQLLRRDLPLGKGDRKLMDIIERGQNQLETLVRDFLFLAPSKGAVRVDAIDAIDVVDMINEVLESVRLSEDWNGDVCVTRRFKYRRLIRGNRKEVRQAIQNVMTNAMQAMNEGGDLTIETRPGKDGDCVEIEIRDTGCGIDPGNMVYVRDPFFTTREGGTGLGLVIVEKVMESHGGYCRIDSNAGEGTRVVMGFPAAEEVPEEEKTDGEHPGS